MKISNVNYTAVNKAVKQRQNTQKMQAADSCSFKGINIQKPSKKAVGSAVTILAGLAAMSAAIFSSVKPTQKPIEQETVQIQEYSKDTLSKIFEPLNESANDEKDVEKYNPAVLTKEADTETSKKTTDSENIDETAKFTNVKNEIKAEQTGKQNNAAGAQASGAQNSVPVTEATEKSASVLNSNQVNEINAQIAQLQQQIEENKKTISEKQAQKEQAIKMTTPVDNQELAELSAKLATKKHNLEHLKEQKETESLYQEESNYTIKQTIEQIKTAGEQARSGAFEAMQIFNMENPYSEVIKLNQEKSNMVMEYADIITRLQVYGMEAQYQLSQTEDETEKQALQEKIDEYKAKIDKYSQDEKAEKEQYDAKIQAELQKADEIAQAKIAELEASIKTFDSTEIDKEISKLEKEITKLEQKYDNQVKNYEQKAKELTREIKELKAQNKALNEKIDSLETQKKELEN